MTYKLFLDDERIPEDVTWVKLPSHNSADWVIVRDFWAFKEAIRERGIPAFVAFDHDLGMAQRDSREKNGAYCAEYLVLACMRADAELPPFAVHSMNPVGADNIRRILNTQY